jgi:hypothetical protein
MELTKKILGKQKIRVVDPDSFESRSKLFPQSGSGLDPVLDSDPDSDPDLVWIQIRIDKKGWIRIWIRIQMNPDPQPCRKCNAAFISLNCA